MKKITTVIPLGFNSKFDALSSLKGQRNKIEFLTERGPNPSRNRNIGARKAKTEFISFINGHTILTDNWADEVIKFFKKYPKVDVVGGPQLNYEKDSLFAKTNGYALSSIFASGPSVPYRYTINELTFDAEESQITSANLICRKKVLKKVRFNERIYPGEDPRFITDSKRAGFTVAYCPDIRVYNRRRDTFSSLMKQIFHYGRVRPIKDGLINTMKKPAFFVPSAFITYLLFLPYLLMITKLFIFPLLLYIELSIFFSIFEGTRNKHITSIFLLPFVFFAIHLSYGFGFIWGSFSTKRL